MSQFFSDALPHSPRQFAWLRRRILFRASLDRHKTRQAALLEGGPRPVKHLARRESEGADRFCDRLSVGDTTKHLIFDLNDVARIEEVAGGELLIENGFRLWIERSWRSQVLELTFSGFHCSST